VRNLQATTLHVELLPGRPDPEPADPFELPDRLAHPLDVTLELAGASDIVIYPEPDAEPIRIDNVSLIATLADSRLDIERIDVRSPLLTLEARASVIAAGDYPVDAHFEWTLRFPDLAEMPGTTRIYGTLMDLRIDQALGAPYNTQLQATLTNLLGGDAQPHVFAEAKIQQLHTVDIGPDLPSMTWSLDTRVEGPIDALAVEASTRVDGFEPGTVDATVSALIGSGAVHVRELVVTQPEHDGQLTAMGRVAFDGQVAADLHIAWERLQWPLHDTPAVRSARGELRFTGPPDDYALRLSAAVEVPERPAVMLDVVGSGNLEAIALELHALTDAGAVTGHAQLTWEPALTASVELNGQEIDPEAFVAGWPGRVGFGLAVDAEVDDETIRVQVHRLEASGTVRDAALALQARATYVQRPGTNETLEHAVVIDALNLSLGSARVAVEGRIAATADLEWRLDAPRMSDLLPGASGQLAGSGTVTGAMPRPRVRVELTGTDFAYEDYMLERLDLDADVVLDGTLPSSLALDMARGELGGIDLEQIELRGAGLPGDHRLNLSLRTSAGDADVDVEGHLEEFEEAEPSWYFRITEARLAYPDLAPWILNEAAEGVAGAGEVSVSRNCWASDDARLCFGGQRTASALDFSFELSGLGFGYFEPLMSEDYAVSGELSASGTLAQRDDGPLTGDVEVTTSAGEFELADRTGTAHASRRFRLEPSQANLSLTPQQAVLDVAFVMEHGHVRLNAQVLDPNGETPPPERPLRGSLSVDVPDLSFIAEIVPELTRAAGHINGELDLAGTLQDPTLSGRLALEEGLAQLPVAGITLTDIEVEVRGHGRDGIALSAQAHSGAGSISVIGELSLLGDTPLAELRIQGDEFQLANTRDARIFISPDLTIDAGAERVDVVGEVFIPRAEITPQARPPAAVTASADEVLEKEDANDIEQESGRAFHARVRIRLGDAVSFDGFGLTARFEGNVLAVQAPNAPATGTGELRILDGEYRAYGQGLVIETGRVYFAGGPVSEPAIDIRAVRRPQEGIVVGAHVVGTLAEPEFTLFSEPSMTQQEQLSYLVLGRSLQNAPQGERSALSQAALAMSLRGGDFLARNIGERIGVDQLTIETGSGEAGAASDPSQAALVAGKYLTPRLYVSYGIGLFDPVNVLRLQYAISQNWQLVTESSSESTGADVVYTFERGR
jgi:translocation and assembly module TamB